ncbi:hypothetical protein [Vibrio maritimus]|uniref:hypothetical protein n=1 Tax=Vibrio maritimus TaxID=990268 RepID=UPI001F395020|nr:hypothetical protein [Vibrio maritimus]
MNMPTIKHLPALIIQHTRCVKATSDARTLLIHSLGNIDIDTSGGLMGTLKTLWSSGGELAPAGALLLDYLDKMEQERDVSNQILIINARHSMENSS